MKQIVLIKSVIKKKGETSEGKSVQATFMQYIILKLSKKNPDGLDKEVLDFFRKIKNDKNHGTDGFTSEFLRVFVFRGRNIGTFITRVINE